MYTKNSFALPCPTHVLTTCKFNLPIQRRALMQLHVRNLERTRVGSSGGQATRMSGQAMRYSNRCSRGLPCSVWNTGQWWSEPLMHLCNHKQQARSGKALVIVQPCQPSVHDLQFTPSPGSHHHRTCAHRLQ